MVAMFNLAVAGVLIALAVLNGRVGNDVLAVLSAGCAGLNLGAALMALVEQTKGGAR